MRRPPITAALASQVAAEAAAGEPVETIAARQRLTAYVVETIIEFHGVDNHSPIPKTEPRGCIEPEIDPADLARINRLTAVGYSPRKIHKLLGVRLEIVKRLVFKFRLLSELSQGCTLKNATAHLGITQKRARAILSELPYLGPKSKLRKGERYVTEPTRCPTCKAPLLVAPCRACRIKALIAIGERTWKDD